MKKKNTQPLHNTSVVPSIASEFWEKEQQGENSLHTSPDGGTIPALCKVGGTSELEITGIKIRNPKTKILKIYKYILWKKTLIKKYYEKDFPKFPPLRNEEKKMWVTRAYILDNENGKFIVPEEFLYPLTVGE